MPELPEVETVVRTLEKKIKNRKIVDIKVRYKPIIVGSASSFKNKLVGQRFKVFKRRGKYLLFYLDDYLLVSHLRMEGKYSINDLDDPLSKHSHVIFILDNNKELRYNDTRKFGRFEIFPKDTNLDSFKNLGPEPFSNSFNVKYILNYVRNKHIPLKQLLLDQSFVAGIGNIYANEILFKSKLNPKLKSNRIKEIDAKNLIKAIRSILNSSIKLGGTTIKSFSSINHITGRFQHKLKVHTKSICPICSSKIKVIRINGRSTYFCPKCQVGK